ncbi:hypothetical protein ACOSQ3_020559 [Xanthoceras sorbifolium]
MVLEVLRHCVFAFLGGLALSTVLLVHAQNQTGFISTDCGTPKDFKYTEKITGIHYISDENFMDTGVGYNISSEYNGDTLEQPFLNVRSFPDGSRNCYTLKPAARDKTEKFFIRASFMYGNYDGQNKLPHFDLLLDADEWDSVQFKDASTIVFKEIIHVPKKNYIDVCLVNTGSGTPFISALELRPLKYDSYPSDSGISLLLYSRLDLGSMANNPFRLKDDACDRIWSPYTKFNWQILSSSSYIDSFDTNYQLPSKVLQTGAMPGNGSDSLVIDWEPNDPTAEYYPYLHFAELDQSQADKKTREENVYLNGEYWYGPFIPDYLNLSSSGISGDISPFISGLTSIQYLDLSYNNLTGTVPDFLLQLPSLTVLNLRGNNLKGTVQVGLIEKQKNGLLSLSLEGNPDLCLSGSCNTEKKTNHMKVHVIAFVSIFVLLIALLATLWIFKRNKQDDTHVAVKMLSPSSIQGYKQFQAEVELLMRVHHKNLTSLVGYCDEGTNMGLIYEFMANGNLETHLLDKTVANILSWEKRLQIATEAALGLEYIHSDCKPPIVHRDVKSTNILLNEKFQAKLADFGLSRIFPTETGTHVLTSIVGTPGYLDPNDGYSFGVVLLELITSKAVIEKSHKRTHISQWVSSTLANADIKKNSVEIAMACVSPNPAKRPTMTHVVMELNECLAIEMACVEAENETELKDSIELINFDLHSESSPIAR